MSPGLPFADLPALATHLRGELENKKTILLYAYNGTGKTRLSMAFKDMGVFGNPLRQVMHFNIYSADGKLLSPYSVESVDKLEHLSVPGKIPARTQYVIEVKAQDATIRMGGYYELSVTGAVDFGDVKNTSQKARPIDTSLTHPVGPLTQ